MTSSPDKNGWIGKKKDDWTDEDFLLKQGWKPESIAIVKYWIDRSGGWGVLKQQPELETLKTKARFWDDYVNMSKHSTWVEDEAYATMKEKARKWDIFETSPEIKDWLNQMISKAKEWKEKVEKFDNFVTDRGYTLEQIQDWKEKADKYDNMVARGSWFDPDEMDAMKEKARKFDEFTKSDYIALDGDLYTPDLIREWKEKARKWDEHKCPVTLESLYKERLDKINEIVNESITE